MQPETTSPKRRKVLLLTQDLGVWGAQRQVVELARGLDAGLYDVRLATLEAGGPLSEEVTALGIPVECFARRWRWDLSPIWRLARYLRRENIDIIHSFLFLPNFYARLAGSLAQTPAVVSSLRSTGIDGWYRYALDVATCFLCDAVIANSEAGRDHYVRRGGLRNRMVVIHNGLPRRSSAPARDQLEMRVVWGLQRFEHLIGMVAAMERRKDQGLLIRAMRQLLKVHPRTGLVLAGDGTRRARLEALARTLGLQDQVVFLDTIEDPTPLYSLLDVYVQASFSEEGTSNSILEAMAQGLPVIATDIGGNREVVADSITGMIVPACDPQTMAQALLLLLSDPDCRHSMGEQGFQRVHGAFSLDAMVVSTRKVYEIVLERKQVSHGATSRTLLRQDAGAQCAGDGDNSSFTTDAAVSFETTRSDTSETRRESSLV